MASINRFRGSPRATYNGLIRHVTTVTPSATGQDLLTTVGPTVTLQIPNGLLEGDLVVVYCYYRGATQNWSVSNAAGQMWVPCATHRSTTQMVQAFYCRFNGVWPAAPAFTIGSGTETAVVTLHGFRSTRGRDARWALDQSPLLNSGAGTGFTITGVTPQSRDTLAIACVASSDDNEYTLTTPGRWTLFGPFKQYRSTGGTDGAMAFAHLPQTNVEATGNLTFTQATLGADAGITMVLVFKDTDTAYDGKQQISRAPSRKAPGKRMFVAAARSAESPAPAGGTVTGNLAATESADTFAATGNVIVQGTLAATESADTFSATGDVVVQGTLAATEGADTFAATGSVATVGTLAATESADTFAATGTVLVEGTLAATEGADTFAATGTVLVKGDLAATEGADTAEFIGASVVTGNLAATEGADTFAATGIVITNGALAANESPDTFAATGVVLIQGTMAATEGADVFAATGTAGGGAGVPSGGSGSWRRRRRMSR